MRELMIGDQKVRVRATPLALLYYKQEFKSDLLGDLMKMQQIQDDPSQLDTIAILQLIWAMAKADSLGTLFPSFNAWMESLERIDFSDQTFMIGAMEEAAEGFFRSESQGLKQKGSAR